MQQSCGPIGFLRQASRLCCRQICNRFAKTGAETAGHAHAARIKKEKTTFGIVDGQGSVIDRQRPRRAHPVKRTENLVIVRGLPNRRIQMKLCGGKIVCAKCEERETLVGAQMISLTFQGGLPGGLCAFIIPLVGGHPTEQVVRVGQGGIVREPSLRHRRSRFQLATLAKSLP
jgi:hypothetical protein